MSNDDILRCNIKLEAKINKSKLKYLLTYDNVNLISLFGSERLTINDLNDDSELSNYLILQSKKRALKRVNSKINRLNKYYNSSSELFARAFEYFIFEQETLNKKSPNVFRMFKEIYLTNKIPIMTSFVNIFNINFK